MTVIFWRLRDLFLADRNKKNIEIYMLNWVDVVNIKMKNKKLTKCPLQCQLTQTKKLGSYAKNYETKNKEGKTYSW